MADVKRGKLESVHIRPNHDEKGKVKDYTVEAHHENADKGKKGQEWVRPEPIVDHPKTMDEAGDVAKAHMNKNQEEQGVAGRMNKGRSMREAIGSA